MSVLRGGYRMRYIEWLFWLGLPFLVLLMLWGNRALALPELSRKGYVSCATCHYSPSGSGLLTAYGSVQADELLAAYPLRRPPNESGVSLGAQLRVLQIQTETEKVFRRQFVLMQSDIEASFTHKSLTLVGALGANHSDPFSRRHYALTKISESVSIRAGKFLPLFGLGLPDHNLEIRRGFGPEQERYAAEASFAYSGGSTVVSAFNGGGILRQAVQFDNFQLGASLFVRSGWEGGPFVILWPTDWLFFMGEGVLSNDRSRAYWRLNFELSRGIILYLANERGKNSFSGVGIQLFPVSGVELRGEVDSFAGGYTAWVMGNFWL